LPSGLGRRGSIRCSATAKGSATESEPTPKVVCAIPPLPKVESGVPALVRRITTKGSGAEEVDVVATTMTRFEASTATPLARVAPPPGALAVKMPSPLKVVSAVPSEFQRATTMGGNERLPV
jgi:hypothetical protein